MLKPRRHRFAFFLALAAVLGQLVLPNVHAQSWAERNGDGLLYLFCGQVSPALIEQLRFAPPEILRVYGLDQDQAAKLSCGLCALAHGGTTPTATGSHYATIFALSSGPASAAAATTVTASTSRPPPSRAPPEIS